MKKFAIVISGCGVQDGAEIHESVMAMLAVDLAGDTYQLFAPNMQQAQVTNHLTGQKMDETRNVLVEAARIARGDIKPLCEYNATNYDAILFPGGFGAALNLSDFAITGAKMTVNKEVETAVSETFRAKKVIGAMCIAPVVIAKIIGKGDLTIGNDKGVADAIRSFGANHIDTPKGNVTTDTANKIFTTPCYMLNSSIKDIFEGAKNLVAEMKKAM